MFPTWVYDFRPMQVRLMQVRLMQVRPMQGRRVRLAICRPLAYGDTVCVLGKLVHWVNFHYANLIG